MNYKLTRREEEIMEIIWQNGSMFIDEIVDILKPLKFHGNTISPTARSF